MTREKGQSAMTVAISMAALAMWGLKTQEGSKIRETGVSNHVRVERGPQKSLPHRQKQEQVAFGRRNVTPGKAWSAATSL